MSYRKSLSAMKMALAPLGVEVTTKKNAVMTNELYWLATSGERGTYSALNTHQDRVSLFEDRDGWKTECEKVSNRAAAAMFEAGLVVFSAISAFAAIDGKVYCGGSRDQVCFFHGDWSETSSLNKSMRDHPMATRLPLNPALGDFT